MNSVLETYVSRIDLGEPQRCKNIIVVPVFMTGNHSPEYLTLTEALGQKLASITEVSAAGTVAEVKISNNSDLFLLLVDGEELVGARQNRTLNASILLAGRSETIVPASCTERGRWRYQGGKAAFGDAGFVSPHKLRSFTSKSVSESLMRGLGHKSDQTGVWHHVALCGMSAGASSPTSAMADVVTKMARELEECLQQLKALPGQQGLAVLVNGTVVGVDLLSSARAYQVLHPKLVRSYTLGALLDQKPLRVDQPREQVAAFLEAFRGGTEQIHRGVGCGEDHRFMGQGVAGSALVNDGHVLHLNLYRN